MQFLDFRDLKSKLGAKLFDPKAEIFKNFKSKKNTEEFDDLDNQSPLENPEETIEEVATEDNSSLNDDFFNSDIKEKKNLSPKFKKMIVAALALLVLIAIGFTIINIVEFPKREVEEVVQQVTKSPQEIAREEVFAAISKNVRFGQSKQETIENIKAEAKNIGINYVIDPQFNRIGKYDYLTTYIYKTDMLVAVLHERLLDGNQKRNLSIEFQQIAEMLSQYYPLIETKHNWLAQEKKYDIAVWNKAIIDNEIELEANFENEEVYIKLMVSGINYFNFLSEERKNVSLGNQIIVYTAPEYKNDFLNIVSLAIE